jgi:hypothetical protein
LASDRAPPVDELEQEPSTVSLYLVTQEHSQRKRRCGVFKRLKKYTPAVQSFSRATCSSGTASVTGNAELVGLVVAGQTVLVSNPNLSISLPGGISVIVNEQTSSPSGSAGSMTVNALHVKGPSIDIVVASAQSGITCS